MNIYLEAQNEAQRLFDEGHDFKQIAMNMNCDDKYDDYYIAVENDKLTIKVLGEIYSKKVTMHIRKKLD